MIFPIEDSKKNPFCCCVYTGPARLYNRFQGHMRLSTEIVDSLVLLIKKLWPRGDPIDRNDMDSNQETVLSSKCHKSAKSDDWEKFPATELSNALTCDKLPLLH